MKILKGYARDDLIAICEQASVPQDKWLDRDSAGAQRQVGECFALLKAGCEFTVSDRAGATSSPNPGTLWVRITYKGFDYFDDFEYSEVSEDIFYLPTPDRIESAAGGDWY